jgi:CDP-diacylglycerol--glycerol-3-phosphate 3-phosphatidyltransferase
MFYDSVLDRYGELAIFTGLAIYYARAQSMLFELLLAEIALAGSLLVSYIRARAEGIDEQCTVGLLQRPERIIILCAGTVLTGATGNQLFCTAALAALAVFANITALQRIVHIRRKTLPGNK